MRRIPAPGRLPTQTGLRLFIDGLLEIGDISDEERSQIESRIAGSGRRRAVEDPARRGGRDAVRAVALRRRGAGRQAEQAAEACRVRQSRARAGRWRCWSARTATSRTASSPCPKACRCPRCTKPSNYLNARIAGLTLAEARARIEMEIEQRRAQLDELTARVVTEGLATWSGAGDDRKSLIVCGPLASAGGRARHGGSRAGPAAVRGPRHQDAT